MLRPLFSLLSPAGAGARLSILIFHRVHEYSDPLFPGEVTRDGFAQVCRWLKAWFDVLPLAEAVHLLSEGRLPSRAAAITFDDGYADNHNVALPVLKAAGLPATFFVATGCLDGGLMWNDRVIESVRRAALTGIDTHGTPAAALGTLACHSLDERRRSIERAIAAIKYLPPVEREAWVHAIAERSGAALPADLMMSSAQVRTLHAEGMGIGAHTVSHPILAGLEEAAAAREIGEGRQRLAEIVDARIGLFAYPNGRPGVDYNEASVRLVRELGFDAAVSTAWGAAGSDTDPWQLPRFTPWDRTRGRFGLRLARNLWSA